MTHPHDNFYRQIKNNKEANDKEDVGGFFETAGGSESRLDRNNVFRYLGLVNLFGNRACDVMRMNRSNINKRVVQVAESKLYHQHYVSPVDVLMGIGYLQPVHLQDWRKGKIPYLESVIQANLGKISFAMKCFRAWAHQKGLKPSQTAYLARTRGSKKDLQFSKSGNPEIEEAYRTHYVSPLLGEKKQEKLKGRLEKPPELVAFIILTDRQCSQCQKDLGKGSFLFMEGDQPLCMKCAGFDHLVFLPSGDAQLTRKAKKYSAVYLVVVKFNRMRKRYERQGFLVEEDALRKGESEGVTSP